MNKEEALQIISQVCAQFQANLATHQQIQVALEYLSMLVEPTPAKLPVKPKKK